MKKKKKKCRQNKLCELRIKGDASKTETAIDLILEQTVSSNVKNVKERFNIIDSIEYRMGCREWAVLFYD